MIRLSKKTVLYNYTIDENGTIRDDEGVIQKISLGERPYFKRTPIHQIMMYTFYGYRDGKIWHIHHIDKNPLNNKLENLIYLTKSEHMKFHHNNRSEETKKKISEAKIGKRRKPFSKETKRKMSEARKAYWANKNK